MNKLAMGVVVGVILLVGIGWAATAHFPAGIDSSTTSSSETSAMTSNSASVASSSVVATEVSSGNSSGSWLSESPAFSGDSSKIDYPPDYGAIANFTLGVINRDRQSAGLQPVTLSGV